LFGIFHEVNYQIPLETVAKTMPFLPPQNIITIFIAGISTMTKWVVNMTFPDAPRVKYLPTFYPNKFTQFCR
jgi:hypothetical protein